MENMKTTETPETLETRYFEEDGTLLIEGLVDGILTVYKLLPDGTWEGTPSNPNSLNEATELLQEQFEAMLEACRAN